MTEIASNPPAKSTKKKAALVLLGILTAGYAGYEFLRYCGRDDLAKIAKERNFCKSADCEEGMNEVMAILERTTNASSPFIEFCVGIDTLARTRVYRGGLIKWIIVDTVGYPCQGLFGKKEPKPEANG